MSSPGRDTTESGGRVGAWTILIGSTVLWLAVVMAWPRTIRGLSPETGLAQFVFLSTALAVGGGILSIVRAVRDVRKGGGGCLTAGALIGAVGLAMVGGVFAFLVWSRAAEILDKSAR